MTICPARNSSSPWETVPVMMPILKLMARSGGADVATAFVACVFEEGALPQPASVRSETESAATKAEAEDTRERSEIDMGELPPPAVAGYRGR
jgi:hypothetical protein